MWVEAQIWLRSGSMRIGRNQVRRVGSGLHTHRKDSPTLEKLYFPLVEVGLTGFGSPCRTVRLQRPRGCNSSEIES